MSGCSTQLGFLHIHPVCCFDLTLVFNVHVLFSFLGGSDRQPEGAAGAAAVEAAVAAGVAAVAASQPHHGARQGAHRDEPRHLPGQARLLSGERDDKSRETTCSALKC